MSEVDKKKENKEYEDFLKACEYSDTNNVHETTKKIMSFLNGEKIERVKNDRPDLITRSKWGNKEFIVGIESFYVDQNSKTKRGQLHSKGKQSEALLQRIYEKGHEQFVNGEEVSIENIENLFGKTMEYCIDCSNSEYEMLINTFKGHFDKHAANAKTYKDNIMAIANNSNVALAFYIEVETHFFNLFLNHKGKIIQYNSKISPFFSDFVSIIENNPNKKYIDYIAFNFKSQYPSENKVVAIRTGNIRENLEKQGLIVYECLINKQPKNRMEAVKTQNGEVFGKFTHGYTLQDHEQLQKCVQKAISFKKRGVSFVTSRDVQASLYTSSAITQKAKQALLSEFFEKYPLPKQEEYYDQVTTINRRILY